MLSVKSMRDVRTIVDKILENTQSEDLLIAFDIDITLIQPVHPAVYYPSFIKYLKEYEAIIANLPDEKKELPAMFAVNLPQRLVENTTPQMISAFKKKGVKMMALTASFTGKIGENDRFEVKRYQELQNFGISFEDIFNEHLDITFTQFDTYRNNHPVFYRGILSSNGEDGTTTKGSVLVAFLETVNIAPKVIIMVDDKKKNLDAIRKSLDLHHPSVKFIGIEYQGAFDYAPEDIDLEEFKTFWQNLANQALNNEEESSRF